MAFDRTNTADLQALSDEESLDPISMGYLAVAGQTQKTLDLFNTASSNLGNDTGGATLTTKDLLEILFDENISSQDQFKLQLLFEATAGFDDDVSSFRGDVSALSASLATAITAHTRPLNRVEVLFGGLDADGVHETVNISRADWAAVIAFRGV